MTTGTRNELATRLADLYRLGCRRNEWLDVLDSIPDDDMPAAWAAFFKLRNTIEDGRLPIPTFRREYHRQRNKRRDGDQPTLSADGCTRCDRGWINTTYVANLHAELEAIDLNDDNAIAARQALVERHTYTGVYPCTCHAGRQRQRTHDHVTNRGDHQP